MIIKRKYPWFGIQDWSNILFMHWPIPPEVIRPFIPEPLKIETFYDSAWISAVVFQANRTRLRWAPKKMAMPSFIQINLRTYVSYSKSEERGVYFLNVFANNVFVSFGAQKFFRLPYYNSSICWKKHGQAHQVTCILQNAPILSVQFCPKVNRVSSELSEFLTERYCIWTIKDHNIIKIPIVHSKWKLQQVSVQTTKNNLLPFNSGIHHSDMIAYFSLYKQARLFPYEINGNYIKK